MMKPWTLSSCMRSEAEVAVILAIVDSKSLLRGKNQNVQFFGDHVLAVEHDLEMGEREAAAARTRFDVYIGNRRVRDCAQSAKFDGKFSAAAICRTKCFRFVQWGNLQSSQASRFACFPG